MNDAAADGGASPPAWVGFTDHAVIVSTCYRATGVMSFEGASPHLVGENRDLFLAALRRDIGAVTVERARPVFREVPQHDREIQPETCTPYVDANGFGYYLKNVLPLVFVRTKRGEVLPEARVALKYLRENATEFSSVLGFLGSYAPRIFRPEAYNELRPQFPLLFSDVGQPYTSFSNKYMAMPAGCYVKTPPGVATMLGPPINQQPVLPLHTGLMESEWHHSELFLVFDCPQFAQRLLVIEPDTVLAQLYFVAKGANDASEVVFSEEHKGADPAYSARSIEVGLKLLECDKEFVISKMTGVKSLSVACPHCWVSVTAAAEHGVSGDHVSVQDFYQGYKALRAEYHKATRRRLSTQGTGSDPRKENAPEALRGS
jgi:hypothetical protein